jgi:hypothetical protein
MLACHGGVIFRLNPYTEFKSYKDCGFLLQLGLPACCHQGCLDSPGLPCAVSSSFLPPGEQGCSCGLFSTFLLPFCYFVLFSFPVILYLIPNVLPLFLFSEKDTLTLLICSHMEEISNPPLYPRNFLFT